MYSYDAVTVAARIASLSSEVSTCSHTSQALRLPRACGHVLAHICEVYIPVLLCSCRHLVFHRIVLQNGQEYGTALTGECLDRLLQV